MAPTSGPDGVAARVSTVEIRSSTEFSSEHACEQWEALVSNIFVPVSVERVGSGEFVGSVADVEFDRFGMSMVGGSPQQVRRTRRQVVRSGEQYLVAIMPTAGSCRIEQQNRVTVTVPGSITFCDTSRPFTCRSDQWGESVVVRAPLQHVLDETGLSGDELPTALSISGSSAVGVLTRFFSGLAELNTVDIDQAAQLAGHGAGLLNSAVLLAARQHMPSG